MRKLILLVVCLVVLIFVGGRLSRAAQVRDGLQVTEQIVTFPAYLHLFNENGGNTTYQVYRTVGEVTARANEWLEKNPGIQVLDRKADTSLVYDRQTCQFFYVITIFYRPAPK